MPERPKLERLTLVALVLALLMLADPLARSLDHVVAAASEADPQADPAAPLADPADPLADPADPLADPADATPSEDALVCVSGFGDTDMRFGLSLHGVALTGRGALAVGFSRTSQSEEMGQRRPAALFNSDDQWSRVWTASPGVEDGLVAVTAAAGGTAWAVGFTTMRGQTMPLAMRWDGRSWSVDRPKPAGAMTSLLTDVTMVSKYPFAVGYRMTANGSSQPIAARRDGKRWRYVSPRIRKRESMSLTGVAPDGRGGLWVVGHGGPGTEIEAVIFRRDNARWSRQKTPQLKGEAVLTDVVASSGRDAWAVGYQRIGGRSLPLVLHWNGRTWAHAAAPDFGSDEVLLTAVTASPSGGVWVVGAAWNAELSSHEAVAAWWDGQAWNEVAGIEGGTELHDVVGSLDADGWAVGRSGLRSQTARVCLPPRSGIFGGSEPSLPQPGPDGLAAGDSGQAAGDSGQAAGDIARSAVLTDGEANGEAGTEASRDTAGTGDIDETRGTEQAGAETTASTAASATSRKSASSKKSATSKKQKSRAKPSRRRSPARLPTARPADHLFARDVAREAGIFEQTATYGAVVADFDADGVDDLYIGRHGRPGRLLLNRDGEFVDHEPMQFPPIDRHGCTAADIDGSGLPDLYCAIGGKRGSGLKSNELWLDPGGLDPVEAAVGHGVSDPTGRGRRANFLEDDGADTVDLVVTNSPTRVDGLPSIGRLYRTQGEGLFTARARTGFAARLGSLTVQDADFDGDGREDLVLVTGGPQAPRQEGTHLYRNTRRGLVDVTRQLGIRPFGEIDAKLVDLDGDDKLDLVQLSDTRLRISQLRNGRYRTVYERKLTYGRAVSAGDVNGDGKDDLYILRSNGGRNVPDVMLINRSSGRGWSALTIPQATSGHGDDVVAIDHDGNGLDDFVVLNGRNSRGPIQLVAFFRR